MAEACPLLLTALSLRIQLYWLMPSGTTSMVFGSCPWNSEKAPVSAGFVYEESPCTSK